MPNPGGQFLFKIGDRVLFNGKRVRIMDRTIESALGKTYKIRYSNGRNGGYVPESRLSKLENHVHE